MKPSTPDAIPATPDGAASAADDRRRTRRALLVFLLAIATILVSLTGAYFTDSQAVSGDTFTTGSVALSPSVGSQLVTFASDMAPGDHALGTETVDNAGSLELRYAVTSDVEAGGDTALASQLQLTVWDESVEDDTGTLGLAADNSTCDATPADVAGSELYSGKLADATTTSIIGDVTQGQQAGDQVLAGGASQVLCFWAELPSSTGNSYQNATTAVTFDFQAEQTKNNA